MFFFWRHILNTNPSLTTTSGITTTFRGLSLTVVSLTSIYILSASEKHEISSTTAPVKRHQNWVFLIYSITIRKPVYQSQQKFTQFTQDIVQYKVLYNTCGCWLSVNWAVSIFNPFFIPPSTTWIFIKAKHFEDKRNCSTELLHIWRLPLGFRSMACYYLS